MTKVRCCFVNNSFVVEVYKWQLENVRSHLALHFFTMGSAFVVWSFVFLILIVKAMGKRTKKFELPDDGSFDGNFLYLKNSGLVVDFHPESESNPSKPSFIFGTDKGPRLVEFYAPWCPHVSAGMHDHHVKTGLRSYTPTIVPKVSQSLHRTC